jgi:thioredoxin
MATTTVTKDNLEDLVEKSDILVLDFWAEWCGPCKSFAPVFEKASEEYPDVTFGKIDTEDQPEVAGFFRIQAIPTLVVFREQIPIFSQAGALPKEALDELLTQVKGLDMEEVRAEMEKREAELKAAESA